MGCERQSAAYRVFLSSGQRRAKAIASRMLIEIIVAKVKFADAIPWATNTPTIMNKSK